MDEDNAITATKETSITKRVFAAEKLQSAIPPQLKTETSANKLPMLSYNNSPTEQRSVLSYKNSPVE